MSRLVAAVAVAMLAAPPSLAQETALSPADAARTVCAKRLDAGGKPTGDRVCKTGRQWEVAFRQTARDRQDITPAQATSGGRPFLGQFTFPQSGRTVRY